MAVALGGLALVVAARGTESARNDDASREDGAPSVVAGDPSQAGNTAGGLGDVVSGQSIQLVDFGEIDQAGNACNEALPGEIPRTIRVSEGRSDVLDEDWVVRLVVEEGVVYGNLDDDDDDEAVVQTTCQFGANGQQEKIQVWDLETGSAVPKASVGQPTEGTTGRFPGTVQNVAIEDGQLAVTWSHFTEDDPACCPSQLTTLRYEVDGNRLVPVGGPETRAAN